MDININLEKFNTAIDHCKSMNMIGKVVQIVGLVIECNGPNVSMGELCYVHSHFEDVEPLPAEVVGFREGYVLLMPLGETKGIGPGCQVVSAQKVLQVKVARAFGKGYRWLGEPYRWQGTYSLSEGIPYSG